MGDRFATIDMGRKLEAVPLRGRTGSPSNTMWPGPRPSSVPCGIDSLKHIAIDDKLHGSVATRLRCGGIFSEHFRRNLLSANVKEFHKSIDIWRSLQQK